MSNYKLNTVHFRLKDKEFSIFCTMKQQPKTRKINSDIRRCLVRRKTIQYNSRSVSGIRETDTRDGHIAVKDSEDSVSSVSTLLSSAAVRRTGARCELQGPETTVSSGFDRSDNDGAASIEGHQATALWPLADGNRELKIKNIEDGGYVKRT